jgi:hypothetical protein
MSPTETPTSQTVPEILDRAAEILTTQGSTQQGGYEHTRGLEPEASPLDLSAAIAKAAGIDIHSLDAKIPNGIHASVVLVLFEHVFNEMAEPRSPHWALSALADWQDAKGRTAGQVIAALRGAAESAAGAAGPFYPRPGSPVPDRPGFVVAECGHRVAASEWRAGFRQCERCPSVERNEPEDERAAMPPERELAAAIHDALALPEADTRHDYKTRDLVLGVRVAAVVGALEAFLGEDLATAESAATAIRKTTARYPVLYRIAQPGQHTAPPAVAGEARPLDRHAAAVALRETRAGDRGAPRPKPSARPTSSARATRPRSGSTPLAIAMTTLGRSR